MKKLLLTSVCTLVVTGAAFAQGTFGWSVISAAGMTAQVNNTIGPLFGGTPSVSGTYMPTTTGAFYFELLYNTAFTGSQIAGPTLAALTGGSWIDTGLEAINATASAGKLVAINPNTAAVVPGWVGGIGTEGGTTNNIVLVGWSSNLGTSWSAVAPILADWYYEEPLVVGPAYFGESNTGYIVPNINTGGIGLGASVFASAANNNGLPINSLNTQLYALPVPEPAMFALAGLGGLSLLLFRRRK